MGRRRMMGAGLMATLVVPAWAAEPALRATAIEEVVVTARAGAGDLRKVEASYAVSTLSRDDLDFDAPLSVADTLKAVPGFWVESSGGEASNNVRTRGIPRDGYSSIVLQENGLAVQHDGGLGYLNADQSFRLDQTIERVEVVRGGPAALFASNGPGGLVNFITRKPEDAPQSVVKLELGDYDHVRLDAFYGQPFGGGWYGSIGGFYRENDGVRDPGFTANEGGQVRVGLGRELDRGEVYLDLKHIRDNVAFLLPIPLTFDDDGDIDEIPGFDGNYGNLAGPEVEVGDYRNVGDPYHFDLSNGTDVELTQFTLSADYDLGGGWTIQNTFRYRRSDTLRNGLFPTGGIESAGDRLESYGDLVLPSLPAGSELEMRFANHPDLIFDPNANAGNGLVLNGNLLSVEVPLDERINDLRLVRMFETGSMTHDVAIGLYYADYEYDFVRYMATAQFEVRDQARLLDLVAINGGEDVLDVTENGILRYGSLYDNVHGTGEALAVYVSDEWQVNDALRIDGGVRWERSELGGRVEGKTTIDLGVPGTLADDQLITGSGEFSPIDRDYDDIAWTLGGNYQIRPNLGVFARYTDSFRAPNASDFNGDPARTDLRVEDISMVEAGVKWVSDRAELFATAFYTLFDNIRFTDFRFDNTSNEFVQQTAYGDTETLGLELEGQIRPSDWFDLSLAATLQQPEYRTFEFTEIVDGEGVARDFGGNQLIRVPEIAIRGVAGINLLNDRLRAELEVEHFSDRYADAANGVELPEYTTLGMNVRYQISERLTVQANATNLTNEIGLTEGNPRSGQFVSGDAGAEFFLARPILGRTVSGSVTYAF